MNIFNFSKKERDKTYNIYCDESNIDNPKSKYMVIGSLFVERNKTKEIKEKIKELQTEYKIRGELKWTKTSHLTQEFYKSFFNYLFSLPTSTLSFRCILVNKSEIDYKRFHGEDKELAFYKFYYYLLKNRIGLNKQYYIFVDFKPSKNKDAVRRLGEFLSFTKTTGDIKHIQAYSSKENIFIQIADILTGAVAFEKNKIGSSLAKKELAKTIATSIKKTNLDFCSPTCSEEDKLNIFCIKLDKEVD